MVFDFLPEAKKKWVYSFFALQIPKCASSSIQKVCGERNLIYKHRGLIVEKFAKHPLYRGIFDTRHLIPEHLYSIFGKQVYDYFSFAVVREPIARLVSSWQFGKDKRLGKVYGLSDDTSFSEYVDFLHNAFLEGRTDILILRPQTEWTHNSVFRPTTVIRYENLNLEWANMLEEHKIEGLPTELPWENRSEKEEISLSKCIKTKIEKMFERDFELLGY